MRKVFFRPRAQLDLESIFIHISTELCAPMAARNTVDQLYNAIERVSEMPTLGMVFTNEDLEHEYRRILVKNYWVYYTFDNESLTVWRIFHTRQDIATMTMVEF